MAFVIETPASDDCGEGHGVPKCVFVVNREDWVDIGRQLRSLSSTIEERDCSSGAHGAILEIDYQDLYLRARILERRPSEEILEFVHKISSDEFLVQVFRFIDRQAQLPIPQILNPSRPTRHLPLPPPPSYDESPVSISWSRSPRSLLP